MTHSVPVDIEMRRALPASLEAAEEFLSEFRLEHKALLDRVNCFAAELLLREALTNAIVHGCHADASMQVRCMLRLKGGRLLIAVEDDGDGFDWRASRRAPVPFSDCCGRGIQILRKYANHVRYNDRGNWVAMIKRLCC